MSTRSLKLAVGAALLSAFGFPTSGIAADINLPSKMSWTAYGTTASGYAQAVAIGNALKSKHGVDLRVIPGKNDVSRMAPLRDNKADFCACGVAAYFAQEGVFLFAAEVWGPQPLRTVMTAIGTNNLAMATAKDADIETMADLKGKRVAWVRAGDALNWNVAANLAFAGLTWDDVEKVEVSGFKASVDAIINGQADAAFMSTVTPHAKRLAASPRGIHWPPLPHDDEAGWERTMAAAPVYQKNMATSGAEISKDSPHEGAVYAYPILVTNANMDADTVYSLTRAIVEEYDQYKDAAPGAAGWALDNQNLTWAIPYHEGAIRFYTEKGMWTDEAQAHNDKLVERQAVIAGAWKKAMDMDLGDNLRGEWMKIRADALTKAGFDPVFN